MQAILLREYGSNCTEGKLIIIDKGLVVFRCDTLELPNKNNQFQISCIPTGTYKVVANESKKFGKCYAVQNVPGRTAILIHSGNTTKDTKGCILVGNQTGPGIVSQSRLTLQKLLSSCPEGFDLCIIEL